MARASRAMNNKGGSAQSQHYLMQPNLGLSPKERSHLSSSPFLGSKL
ncbi:unnamed protein product [Gulo gulo]|uniref:Uncharacterized protein n=1 Tax=Gulo gulo TaxID=48420 RepID=A0A9X9PYM2_GULGU|nr:unnamed protein product [Gulo gulo]